MNINIDEFKNLTIGKNIALFGVNKDLINFLKFKKNNLIKLEYNITHVIDFTLDYRTNIKNILNKNIDDTIKIVTSFDDMSLALENGEFDLLIIFEGGKHLSNSTFELLNMTEFDSLVRERYDYYVSTNNKGEYRYQYSKNEVFTIISYITNNYNVDITSAYGSIIYNDHLTLLSEDEIEKFNRKTFTIVPSQDEQVANIPSEIFYGNELSFDEIKQLKPVFVLGADYAVGKSKFIMSKYNGEDNILLNDTYSAIVNPNIYLEDYVGLLPTQYILKNIARLGVTQKDRIYLKIEGRIEEFAFGLPKDRASIWGNFHNLFQDYKFAIIIRPNENMTELKRVLNIFRHRLNIPTSKIEVYRNIDYTNEFELVEISYGRQSATS